MTDMTRSFTNVKRWIMRFLIVVVIVLALGLLCLQWRVSSEMKCYLSDLYGDTYAVLRMNIGGEPVQTVSAWRMTQLLFEYRYSETYRPQGSGGFTGKKNYLVVLVGDNVKVSAHNWSFRSLGFDRHTTDAPIDTIRWTDQEAYRYANDKRKRVNGVWRTGVEVNNPKARFYPIRKTDP
jgi:hypothetical protein